MVGRIICCNRAGGNNRVITRHRVVGIRRKRGSGGHHGSILPVDKPGKGIGQIRKGYRLEYLLIVAANCQCRWSDSQFTVGMGHSVVGCIRTGRYDVIITHSCRGADINTAARLRCQNAGIFTIYKPGIGIGYGTGRCQDTARDRKRIIRRGCLATLDPSHSKVVAPATFLHQRAYIVGCAGRKGDRQRGSLQP